MASDVKNVKLGVCKIMFDGVDLGFTKGGVDVTVSTETHKVQVDQFGQTPINEYILGRTVVVKAPLAETTLENLVKIMPGATLVTDAQPPAKKRVDVPTGVGINLLDFAKELVLHPIGKPDTDKSDDFVVKRAATAGALDFGYKLEDERLFNTEFNAYPDENGKLFSIGDPAAGKA
ncbi:hypothetical protein J682_3459 [Acinetobacter baumannii 214216]|nr:hypothetical protein J682_3459 [Acinetobacter baumannii 214216]